MKKPYSKPEIKKIDSTLIRMLTKQGFTEVFWEEYCIRLKSDSSITREEVFDQLNKKYFDTFGSYRYSSYDSFRRRINQ